MNDELLNDIYNLELELLSENTRLNTKRLDEIIADDFIEHGSSGKVYYKYGLMKILPQIGKIHSKISEFHIRLLAFNLVQAMYIEENIDSNIRTRRSSIWQFNDKDWKIVFHQGTIII